MPWSTTSVSDQRKALMNRLTHDDVTSLSALCREFGISRTTAYKWLARYDPKDAASLQDRSRAPRHHPNATPAARQEAIAALRREHPTWGPKKIRAVLVRDQPSPLWPAVSTIGQILSDQGLVVRRPRRRRPPTSPRSTPSDAAPNALWTIDYKGQFQTQDGAWCYPVTLMDAHSRYLLRCQAFGRISRTDVQSVMATAFREFGLPESIRCDNGSPFGSTGVGRLSRLSVWWIRLGIRLCPIRPGHPEENGAHERFHRTLLEDTAQPAASTRRRQQQRFTAYGRVYNEERPHEALGQETPASRYVPSPRPYPERLPEIVYPDGTLVRYVHTDGGILYNGIKHFLSEVLTGQYVGLFPWPDDQFVVCYGPVPLAVFDVSRGGWLSRRRANPILSAFVARQADDACPPTRI